MKLLALDTSSVSCSAALRYGEEIIERHAERPREHTQLLVPMIRELAAEAGVAYRDLDAIVLGVGPGSFIGVRIATSVAQGIAYASGLGIVPVSSLAAVASAVLANAEAREVIVAQDAHLGEVYLGHYRRAEDGLPAELRPEQLHGQERIAFLDPEAADQRLAAGEAWHRLPKFLEANKAVFRTLTDHRYPRASQLLGLGGRDFTRGRILAPQDAAPAYLRHRVAEPAARTS